MCKKDELMVALAATGWRMDQWGHMQKTVGKTLYRVKFQSISIRIESQVIFKATTYSKARKEWESHNNADLKDVTIRPDGIHINGSFRIPVGV